MSEELEILRETRNGVELLVINKLDRLASSRGKMWTKERVLKAAKDLMKGKIKARDFVA